MPPWLFEGGQGVLVSDCPDQLELFLSSLSGNLCTHTAALDLRSWLLFLSKRSGAAAIAGASVENSSSGQVAAHRLEGVYGTRSQNLRNTLSACSGS